MLNLADKLLLRRPDWWCLKAQTLALLVIIISTLLSACSPARLLVPTPTASPPFTATPSRTPRLILTSTQRSEPTPTASFTLAPTDTVTATRTARPTRTPTPPPGIGAWRQSMMEFYRGVDFKFTGADYVGEELVVIGYSRTGFTALTLRGGPGFLKSAEIEITTSGEPNRISLGYWQAFLGFTTPDAPAATDWVMQNLPKAGEFGRVETRQGHVKIILEVDKDTLKISIFPW